MIYVGSRYQRDPLFLGNDPSGNTQVSVSHRSPRIPRLFSGYDSYIWKYRDRMDLLASRKYGSAHLWWVIAEANPTIFDIMDIIPGTVIRIPRAA